MSTWIPRAFGGDRIIQPPTPFDITPYLKPSNTTSSAGGGGLLQQPLLVRPVPPTVAQARPKSADLQICSSCKLHGSTTVMLLALCYLCYEALCIALTVFSLNPH